MTSDIRSQIQESLPQYQADVVRFASDLIAVASENPPGNQYDECVRRIRLEWDRLGLSYRSFDAPGRQPRSNLLSFVGQGARAVYFHGHYDVVPAQTTAQFTPRIQGGYLYGRGSADMKAGLAAMTYAAFLLQQLQVPLHGRVGLCFVADEETGGKGGSRFLEQIGVLGQDGIAMFTMEPTSGVVWHANRGAITLKITVKGRSAHVGLQHQGINAFEQMLKVAARLQGLKAEVEQRQTRFRISPDEAAGSILMLGGVVEGGANFNVVPESCSFTVERRFNPEETLETEKARLFSVLESCRRQGIDHDVEILQEGHANEADEQHPVAQILADTIESVTGERPPFEMCPGLLETRWYGRRGIPAFAYGPGLLGCAHGPEERVEIGPIYQHTVIYALTAARLLATPG
jgi:acetylornithine deacetylase/succinyl-diaminopimelate desuccinylase family protein